MSGSPLRHGAAQQPVTFIMGYKDIRLYSPLSALPPPPSIADIDGECPHINNWTSCNKAERIVEPSCHVKLGLESMQCNRFEEAIPFSHSSAKHVCPKSRHGSSNVRVASSVASLNFYSSNILVSLTLVSTSDWRKPYKKHSHRHKGFAPLKAPFYHLIE